MQKNARTLRSFEKNACPTLMQRDTTSRTYKYTPGIWQPLHWLKYWIYMVALKHRRRMERDAKAKVVTSVWGAELLKFLAELAVLPWSVWKKQLNSSYSYKSTENKTAGAARNWTKSFPQKDAMTFAFASLSILLLCAQGWGWRLRKEGGWLLTSHSE